MANITTWVKDENGNIYQLLDNTKLVGCTVAWAKDSRGNVFEFQNNTRITTSIQDENNFTTASVQRISTNKAKVHVEIHGKVYLMQPAGWMIKIQLFDNENKKIELKNVENASYSQVYYAPSIYDGSITIYTPDGFGYPSSYDCVCDITVNF